MNEKIKEAVEALKNGGVIVYPTETVYGLGADIFNEKAVKKIAGMKGWKEKRPISVALKEDQIEDFAVVDDNSLELIDRLPGPMTLVLRKQNKVPNWITETDYVGLRVPESETAMLLAENFGPITSTSANVSGQKAPYKVENIDERIKEKADYILDEGETRYKAPSTVVKINDDIEILRDGVLEI
ncbi:MAG: L-threonylcarbamoyladenylate synthase [Candidatus Undinarchaeales archaeon]